MIVTHIHSCYDVTWTLCSKALWPVLFFGLVYLWVFVRTTVLVIDENSNKLPVVFPNRQLIFSPEEQETLEHAFPYGAHPLLIAYIRQRLLVAPSSGLNSLPSSSTSNGDLSQTGISGFIDELLDHREGGFYVDCGAYDGKLYSKTAFFETERAWTGLLIEPHPTEFTNLLLQHRNAYAINVAASPTPATGKFYFLLDGLFSGLATFPKQILDRLTPPVSIVQAYTLFSLILATNRTHVDYLALNVAGTELEILQTVPFHLITFNIISVGYRRQHDMIHISEEESRKQLQKIREFFQHLPQYREVGIAPIVDKTNRTLSEGQGNDVIYASRDTGRTQEN